MRRFASTRTTPGAWLTICFASMSLLFSTGRPLLAQMSAMDFRYGGHVQAIQDKLRELRKAVESDDKAAFKTKLDQVMRSLDELKQGQQALEQAGKEVVNEVMAPDGRIVRITSKGGKVIETEIIPEEPGRETRRVLAKGAGDALENAFRSYGDAGLVTLLRFEKAKVCRKAGMYDEAVSELQKIVEEDLADETTNAARWTLVEILQEQKKNEEAMAELEKIFISASETQDRIDAVYGIINLSGEGPKARIQAIDRLIRALLRDQANWDQCTKNLEQLYAAGRKYAADHGGRVIERLSELYPDYVNNLSVFTCPASDDPKITRKEDIDSLSSYVLVAKRQPAEGPAGEAANTFPDGGRSERDIWIREKEQNHGRRYLVVWTNGSVGWIGARQGLPPPLLDANPL